MVNFENLLVHPKSLSDFIPASLRYRQKLDSSWEFLSDPYSAWRAKRLSVKDELFKLNPGYTKSEINGVFYSIGLSDQSDPRNKHYVRCMHD